MPRHSESVRMALWTSVDYRAFGAVDLFHRGDAENPVAAPAWAGRPGLFRTPLASTVGHGSDAGFADDLDTAWQALGGAAGKLLMTLGGDDRWRITNLDDTAAALVEHSDNTWWGFDGEVVILAGTTVTATGQWRRGMVWSGVDASPPRLRLARDGVEGSEYVPRQPGWITDIIVGARTRLALSDVDDRAAAGDPLASTSLEARDIATHGAGSGIRWGHTDDGHRYWTQPVDAPGAGNPITWLDDDFREECGASGSEPLQQTGAVAGVDVYYQIFDYPDPALVISEWPIDTDIHGFATEDRKTATTRDGRNFHRYWRHDILRALRFRVDGPVDRLDWHQHYIRRFLARAARNRGPMWVVSDWGDSRLAAERGGYSLLQTVEHKGYRGRYAIDLRGDFESEVRWLDDLMSSALVELSTVEAG